MGSLLAVSFENAQFYLFLCSMLVLPVLLAAHVPVLQPLFRVRIEDKLFSFVLLDCVKNAACFSLLVFSAFVVGGLSIGLRAEISIAWPAYLLRCFIFVMCCFVLCYAGYFLSGKKVLSVTLVMVINFVLIAVLWSIDGRIGGAADSQPSNMLILQIYMAAALTGGLSYLYFNSKRRECL